MTIYWWRRGTRPRYSHRLMRVWGNWTRQSLGIYGKGTSSESLYPPPKRERGGRNGSRKFRGEVPRTLSVSDAEARNEDGNNNCKYCSATGVRPSMSAHRWHCNICECLTRYQHRCHNKDLQNYNRHIRSVYIPQWLPSWRQDLGYRRCVSHGGGHTVNEKLYGRTWGKRRCRRRNEWPGTE